MSLTHPCTSATFTSKTPTSASRWSHEDTGTTDVVVQTEAISDVIGIDNTCTFDSCTLNDWTGGSCSGTVSSRHSAVLTGSNVVLTVDTATIYASSDHCY